LAIFLATRVVEAVLLVLVTPPGYSYGHAITYWDGGWYRQIAQHGYPAHLPVQHGFVHQSAWAFYPLYPALVRLVMATGMSYDVAAPAVSLLCGAAAMCLLYRMLMSSTGRFNAGLAVLALCTYPAAVLFQSAYTESLALLLVLACLWCLRERRYAPLVAPALLLALARPVVLPLAVVIGVHWLVRWRSRRDDPFLRREARVLAVTGVLTATSFLLWPAIAALRTGRLNAYFVTAKAWDSRRDHGWPSWLMMLAHGDRPGLAAVVVVVVLTLGVVLVRRAAGVWGLELRCWAGAYALFLLAATMTTTSIVRYAMLAIVPWWPFPDLGRTVSSDRRRFGLALAVACVGVVGQVLWMRWFFVLSPSWRSYP
jgi:hypothetical protein